MKSIFIIYNFSTLMCLNIQFILVNILHYKAAFLECEGIQ